MTDQPSLCRICSAMCGTTVTVADGKVTSVRGDRLHPVGRGFACIKGLQAPELLNSPDRILHPLKLTEGGFERIELERALDEIANITETIIKESGPDAIGSFKGTQTYLNATASEMLESFIRSIGSKSFFTTATIDQSSHMVTMARMGYWDAGKPSLEQSDVALLIGTNPLVSIGAYGLLDYDPVKRLRTERRRGLKLIVIDPRRTETAVQADCHLQPVPGQDASIVASLIHVTLKNNWHDAAFCARFVDGMAALETAVAPFTPERVAGHAGLAAVQIEEAAAMFARDARRGIAILGTGATMGPHSNLTDHLVETLNVICGRLLRAGDAVPNAGVLSRPRRFRQKVIPANRCWERGPFTSTGHGDLFGERMSGILADEMLTSGKKRIRALFVQGANPAVALPDQDKAVAGLRRLDLLVAVEPFMTATARLCHYIIPPKMLYERCDVAKPSQLERFLGGPPFNQYVPALVDPPAQSEVIDDWYLYWALGKRLTTSFKFSGAKLDLTGAPPSTDDLLALIHRDSRVPLELVRSYPRGHIFDEESVLVEADADDGARLLVAPGDIVTELAALDRENVAAADVTCAYPMRLIVRRIRASQNSFGRAFSNARRRATFNPLYLHPEDMKKLSVHDGSRVSIITSHARIPAIVASDDTMRTGVASMTHCWGELSDDEYDEVGVSTSRLVRTDEGVEEINAMPTMTAISVRIVPDAVGGPASL